jgi:hypothetical protein
MLHTKIVNSKDSKLLIIEAENLFHLLILALRLFLQERLEIKITIKLLLELLMIVMTNLSLKVLKRIYNDSDQKVKYTR